MKKNKIKIIYIVGYGHSGSTIINMILGSSKNAFSVGELLNIKYWLYRLKTYSGDKKEYICDCGKELENCKFWSNTIKNISSNYYDLIWTKKNMFDVLNYLYLCRRINFNKYNDNDLYPKILNRAKNFKNNNVDIIIDSSKDIRRLITLSQVKNLDLNVIHLIRDGRGVINSMHKTNVNGIKTYIHWVITNILVNRFLKKKISKNKQIKISYDLFAQNPDKYIKLINKKFKTGIDEKNYIEKINKEKFHNFAGNIIRTRKIEGIKYDRSWEKKFNIFENILYTILTYIPNKLWVYNKKYK